MALPDAIQGSRHTGLTITWTHTDGSPQDLTGATLTGRILDPKTGVRPIDGTLTVIEAEAGQFTWAFGPNDVGTPSNWLSVQFTATYAGDDNKPDKTYRERWKVLAEI